MYVHSIQWINSSITFQISSSKDTFLEHLLKAVSSEDSELHFTELSNPVTLENENVSNLELIAYFGGLATSFKFNMTEMLDGVSIYFTYLIDRFIYLLCSHKTKF
jgi:hypothetical protein